ncbi:hypothetical protein UFOVP260_60 [uncultured Caudovirales phage]|uniref:Uncharacterized protein n=1 Tax=uncultured Caudovirales phage TaxID=2100421 RepID=A0A6J7WFY1_9CAUD|nr:hypothetical protein UFOVP85_2 [uncultured Caudovirales phage]CAB4132721.1 hypothetical protein UFOVP260_60 [uncultured Caudovirales phage]CAB4202928.1 hypothetical protein UFOVP1363_45 [uncultured Caudovirales phage]CAB5207114.1 hypothetical protein UFOVP179_19 [uncultured Caudovirales phage]
MTDTGEAPISERELKMGEEMSYITFGELVKELTGIPFDEVYKDFLIHGANHESNME